VGKAISLPRNFLHAQQIQFAHPRTGEGLSLSSPIPGQLSEFLRMVEVNSLPQKRL
jgi:23S rRNA pseudouridine1911/1915/1917 synthase